MFPRSVLCHKWALLGPIGDTPIISTASGNTSQAWQNLGQNKTRLAIGWGCQSTESQNCTHLTALQQAWFEPCQVWVGQLFHPVFGPIGFPKGVGNITAL